MPLLETRLTRRTLIKSGSLLGLTAFSGLRSKEASAMPDPEKAESVMQQFKEARRQALERFPFKSTTVRGTEALTEWTERRAANDGYPIIVGNQEDLERLADHYSIYDPERYAGKLPLPPLRPTEEVISSGEVLRFPESLSDWEDGFEPGELDAPTGDWPEEIPTMDEVIASTIDFYERKVHAEVHLLSIPTDMGWKVPAYLRWGNWNACPPAEYHVAALKHLFENYGAELIAIGPDLIEVKVARPPTAQDEALRLARAIYQYCPDSVEQGAGTISNLAAFLMHSSIWSFWWD